MKKSFKEAIVKNSEIRKALNARIKKGSNLIILSPNSSNKKITYINDGGVLGDYISVTENNEITLKDGTILEKYDSVKELEYTLIHDTLDDTLNIKTNYIVFSSNKDVKERIAYREEKKKKERIKFNNALKNLLELSSKEEKKKFINELKTILKVYED